MAVATMVCVCNIWLSQQCLQHMAVATVDLASFSDSQVCPAEQTPVQAEDLPMAEAAAPWEPVQASFLQGHCMLYRGHDVCLCVPRMCRLAWKRLFAPVLQFTGALHKCAPQNRILCRPRSSPWLRWQHPRSRCRPHCCKGSVCCIEARMSVSSHVSLGLETFVFPGASFSSRVRCASVPSRTNFRAG